MSLLTIYESAEEASRAPCPICKIPPVEHTREAAGECFRQVLRHPEADAVDILAAVGGALHGICSQTLMTTVVVEARRLAKELVAALDDRRSS